MAGTVSKLNSLIVDSIKALPVIENQDQEFWLAAAISSLEVLKSTADGESPPGRGILSVRHLLKVFKRCIGAYDEIVRSRLPESRVPSWSQLLTEAIDARERIFQFRRSQLYRSLNGSYIEERDKHAATAVATEIAQCLSVLPLGFLRYWYTCLENQGRCPSVRAAFIYFLDVDCEALLTSIKTEALKARDVLIEGYLRYSLRIALGYVNRGLEYSDLVQEAALGLVLAADRYNYLEHGRFASFANTWMWHHITRSLANDSRLVRLPVHSVEQRQALQKQLAQHLKEVGNTESLRSLVESKGLDVVDSLSLLAAGVLPIRLDSPKPGLTMRELDALLSKSADVWAPEDTHDRNLVFAVMWAKLSPQQREVLSLRFGLRDDGEEYTLDDIGRRFGVTRERIRQVEVRAIHLLQRSANLRQLLLQRVTTRGPQTQPCAYKRTLEAISCDEALNPAHPYVPDNRHSLEAKLIGSFETFALTTADRSSAANVPPSPDSPDMADSEAECMLGVQSRVRTAGVLQGCEPESPQFLLQSMQRIFEGAEVFKEEDNWSLQELAWVPEDHAKLLRWAQIGTVSFQSLSSQRIKYREASFTGLDGIGFAFLALCSHVAQRSAVEGDMWSHVSASVGPQLRPVLFGGSGSPKRYLRDATEDICRKARIRHAFGREGEQSWLRTVFLQFGLSRRGYKRLPFWLGQGALLPVAVQDLIGKHSKLYSQTFSSLWMVLQRYRWGALGQSEANAALDGNPWIRHEDQLDLLASTVSRRDVEPAQPGQEDGEDQDTAITVLSVPRLRWTAAVPLFEIGLQPTPPAWMDGQRYTLTILDQRVSILRTEAEWRMDNAEGILEIEPNQSVVHADLIHRGVSALADPIEIHLTPAPDPFGLYDLATGKLIDHAARGRDFNRPTAILCRAGITLEPSSREFYRAFRAEWIFWAFRDGLPANLEIRDGELVIWSRAQTYREATAGAGRTNRMEVCSFGGWWGETVRVSVAATQGLQLLRIRVGTQRIDLVPTGQGRFQGSLPLLAGNNYSSTAQIEYINEGRLEQRTADLSLSRVNGVALEKETGWQSFESSLDIDIEYFQERRLLARLPSDWEGETRLPEDWVFLEGDHFCQRPRRTISSLRDSLYGVGEPLWLSLGPYNYSSPGRRLTRGLLNSGVIRRVIGVADVWELQLRKPIDLGEEHALWVWLVGEECPRQLRRDQWSQRDSVCEISLGVDQSPAGFAVSYCGAWLGARTASSGLGGFQGIMECTRSWITTAKWLRWWQAPLLHESLRRQLKITSRGDPVSTLVAWLTGDSPGAGAEYSDSQEDAWLSVARGALWGWRPTAGHCSHAIFSLGMMTGDPEVDLSTCWGGFESLLAANPMLLAQLSVCGVAELYATASASERQIFLHMLQALVLGLERNAANADLELALAICQREAAESMSVDERFVTDSLLPMALRHVGGQPAGDLNLRIALANSPIRKFLAVTLIQHATAEGPLRA